MSLLELQQLASQLPFHEQVALMRYLKRSLSKDELEALLLEEDARLLDELESSAVERVMEISWAVQRGQADIEAGRFTENHIGLLEDVKNRQSKGT